MRADLAAFVSQYLGVPHVGNTVDNKGQCVGLIEVWLSVNKHANIRGNAKDLLANADLQVYQMFTNTPTNFPPAGAIVVWDASWGGGNGHTAVALAANVNLLAVFEQNNPAGSAPTVVTHDYAGVAGWIVLP